MYTIVIVDDENEIRNGLSNFFPWNTIGFQVVFATCNGILAYEYIKENKVDIVLSDIVMPELTGLELANRIKTEGINTKVVLMSAYTDFEYAQKAIKYGVSMYVQKAMNYDELMSVFTQLKQELDTTNKLPEPNSPMSYNQKIVCKIKDYIQEHYQEATLNSTASHLRMNPDYISKLFKKTTDITFSEYLSEIRMENAKKFLDDIETSVYEVSELVGYSNQFNFTRAFKHYFGVSPREYRQRGLDN